MDYITHMNSFAVGNIEINYLYRDAGNYKLYGSKVFSNNENLPLQVIRQNIESKLIDGLYFIPETWGIERLKFDKFDAMEDYSWHEIETIRFSSRDVEADSDIVSLLKSMRLP